MPRCWSLINLIYLNERKKQNNCHSKFKNGILCLLGFSVSNVISLMTVILQCDKYKIIEKEKYFFHSTISLRNVPLGWPQMGMCMFNLHLEYSLTFLQTCPSQWMFTVIGLMPVKQPINSHVFLWLPVFLASLTFFLPHWLAYWIRFSFASTTINSIRFPCFWLGQRVTMFCCIYHNYYYYYVSDFQSSSRCFTFEFVLCNEVLFDIPTILKHSISSSSWWRKSDYSSFFRG